MFLAMIAAVRVERNEEGDWDTDGLRIYTWVWIKHLVVFTTLALNMYFPGVLGLGKSMVNTFAMLFEVIVLICICVKWVFPDPIEVTVDVNISTDEVQDNPDTQTDEEVTIEHPSLRFWLQLEVLVFCANIVSNIIFLAFRSCSHRRLDLTPSSDKGHSSDLLEQQQVLMGLCSSYITPFFVTYSITNADW